MSCIGIDTSNYTTSAALVKDGRVEVNSKKLLPVRPGELGLRQSDAVFHHVQQVGDVLEPAIDLYLIVMGVIIFLKVFRTGPRKPRHLGWKIYPLGFAGGFLDATGGGGWGPVVTSTLLASDQDVKKSIGTVNTAEFVVTVAETTTFVALVNDMGSFWPIILGVALGGVIAAPLAAYICKKVPVRPLLAVVGLLIIGLNIYNLIKAVPAFVALLA